MQEENYTSRTVRKRIERVQADILGNEALGGALNEEGAEELLSWGLKSAEGIANETDGMDEESADLSMAGRLKSLRKMMRYLGRLLGEGSRMKDEDRQWFWDRIKKHARALYGEHLEFPNVEDVMEQLINGKSAGQIILDLRKNFEDQK